MKLSKKLVELKLALLLGVKIRCFSDQDLRTSKPQHSDYSVHYHTCKQLTMGITYTIPPTVDIISLMACVKICLLRGDVPAEMNTEPGLGFYDQDSTACTGHFFKKT